MQPRSTAELACKALGLAPVGSVWDGEEPLICALEGIELKAGDRVARFKPGPNYMDDSFLATRSPVSSGWAARVSGKQILLKVQRHIITTEGVFPTATKANRSYFLINPPRPPFAWVISDAPSRHMIWKAPINLSSAQYIIQLGNRLLTIRQEKLEQAVALARESEVRPWFNTDWAASEANFGQLNPKLDAALQPFFRTLTIGEVWATAIVLSATREDTAPKDRPKKPDPISITETPPKRQKNDQ